jgi:hypothetical protein
MVQQPKVQPILVDGGKFATQALVEIVDDFCVALHHALPLIEAERVRPAYLERF